MAEPTPSVSPVPFGKEANDHSELVKRTRVLHYLTTSTQNLNYNRSDHLNLEELVNWTHLATLTGVEQEEAKKIYREYFNSLQPQSGLRPAEWNDEERQELLKAYFLCSNNLEVKLQEPFIWSNIKCFLPNKTARQCRIEFYRMLKYGTTEEDEFDLDWTCDISRMRGNSYEMLQMRLKTQEVEASAVHQTPSNAGSKVSQSRVVSFPVPRDEEGKLAEVPQRSTYPVPLEEHGSVTITPSFGGYGEVSTQVQETESVRKRKRKEEICEWCGGKFATLHTLQRHQKKGVCLKLMKMEGKLPENIVFDEEKGFIVNGEPVQGFDKVEESGISAGI